MFLHKPQQGPLKRPGKRVFLSAGQAQSLQRHHHFAHDVCLVLSHRSVADSHRPRILISG